MMSERALITGITGFVGSHLAEFLLAKGLKVYGIKRWRSKTDNINHLTEQLNLIEADMRDGHSLVEALKEAEPNYIFHLAAQSFVPMSWRAPSDTMETNAVGTIHLLEAIRKLEIDPAVQIAGSSEEYGLVYPDEVPIKETNPLRPLSPYGVSKVAQDKLGFQYHRSYGMKIVVTRSFNHTGPRRGEVFVTSNFAKQIVEIEKGIRKPVIYVGNLEAQRDFSDVRDVIRAYWLSLQKCEFGDCYNICSGKPRVIKDVLNILLEKSKSKDIRIENDPLRMRPSDVEILHGDCSKIMVQAGWKPEIPFEKTMSDLLAYWRERL
ncbi:MAG: GDP-mannose 4,6-dehydratase [Methanomassiliicoccales archaeon]|nr:MAG: GDP-mannose 4,6-dehydratase [Methanomassiliicoccales archaeon]